MGCCGWIGFKMSELENNNLFRNSEKNSIQQIEFLPVWYKQSSQRNRSYLTQYILLAVMFCMILMLDSLYMGFISNAKGGIAENKDNARMAEACTRKYEKLKQDIADLEKYTDTLDRIDSRVNIPNVLGELSFLAGKNIVFSELALSAEGFPSLKNQESEGTTTLRAARNTGGGDTKLSGPVRFKISLDGIAPDAEETAAFVSRLEDSPYFRDVSLLFSRNSILNVSQSRDDENKRMISTFRVDCYLANYNKVTGQE